VTGSLDLITPCRNRGENLVQSLPSWLDCPQVTRIVVVDFNSTPDLMPLIRPFNPDRVRVIRVDEEPLWRQGRAQNVGLRYSNASFILKLDSDIEVVAIKPYLEAMERDPDLFYKGFSKLGSSSGSCLFRRRHGRHCGGWHDHMSGWGGDDVDFYQRLQRRSKRAAVFAAESFRETTQPMESKNREAPRLDSELLENQPRLACTPRFTGVRNTLLSVLQKQNRRRSLRYDFTADPSEPQRVLARLKERSRQELAIGRYSIELANILTIHHFRDDLHPREILGQEPFEQIRQSYQLPNARDRRARNHLLESMPDRLSQLRQLAGQLGIATLPKRSP